MTGKLAETEICEDGTCNVSHLLVRGDVISFVSLEQERNTGAHPLNDKAMPSDIVAPPGHVLVHDTTGTVLDRCELYVVKWRKSRTRSTHKQHIDNADEAEADAHEYFGSNGRLARGLVDIPEGPWHRVGKVRYIRYRRVGIHSGNYEHCYEVPVDLLYCKRPFALRLPLPNGCVVDARGFVWP